MEKQTIHGKLIIDSLKSQLNNNDKSAQINFLKDLENKLINSFEYKSNVKHLSKDEKILFTNLLYKLCKSCNYRLHRSVYHNIDPLYDEISWIGIKKGGRHYRTHFLKSIAPHRVEILPTVLLQLQSVAYSIVSIFIAILLSKIMSDNPNVWKYTPVLLLPVVVYLIYSFFKQLNRQVFDKAINSFYVGKENNEICQLDYIHAIQVLEENFYKERENQRSGFVMTTRRTSYELNLILRNGHQINLTDHPEIDELNKEAEILSKFLDIPVWR